MKKTFLLCIAIALGLCSAHAQDYTLDIAQQPYADLDNPIPVVVNPDDTKDLNYFVALPGFSFRAFDGNLVMDTAGGAMGFYISVHGVMGALETPGDSVLSFYGFWTNKLTGRSGGQSAVSYKVEGAPGDAIFKVQWKDMGFANVPADSVNFQIWLHQRDNSISYHYGPSSISSASAFSGRNGPVVGLSKADPNFTKFYRSLYLAGSPDNPSVKFPAALSVAMDGIPAANTVYTFRTPATAVEEPMRDTYSFRCFPSPFRDIVTFAVEPPQVEYRIVISDALGCEVASAAGRERIVVRCGSRGPGVYFYRILNGGRVVSSGVLVGE